MSIRIVWLLTVGMLASAFPGLGAGAYAGAGRFVRADAAWGRVGSETEYSRVLGTATLDPIQTARGMIQVGWRRPSGLTTGVEVGLGDRGGSWASSTVFRPDDADLLELRRSYLDVGFPVGWRRPLGAFFVEMVAIPRASIRLETPWWMQEFEYERVVFGLDPGLTLGRSFWHVTGRYQWDLTPAWTHDTAPSKSSSVMHVETHDSGFSLGLGIELPF